MMIIWSVDLKNPLVRVTLFVTYLRTRMRLLLKILLFGSTVIKKFGRGRSIKLLSENCHTIPIIKNWYGLIPKSRIGFWLKTALGNTRKKEFLYQPRNIRMEIKWRNLYLSYIEEKYIKRNYNNSSWLFCWYFCEVTWCEGGEQPLNKNYLWLKTRKFWWKFEW